MSAMKKSFQKSYSDIIKETSFFRLIQTKKTLLDMNQEALFEIPSFVSKNIKNELRFYQSQAVENFILANPLNSKKLASLDMDSKQYLFHMATGSGKTLIMASCILYLYELGYRKFIFLTNQTNLINKTRKNLLPHLHESKCEFSEKIEINGKIVNIREAVSTFSPNSSTIEIKFSTIHNLHETLNDKKENSLTIESLVKHKVVVLADEAHHFNASTKSSSSSGKENDENTWELTINKILDANQENKLVEFTATMDLYNNEIFEKYKNKIIYDYPLQKFREDGFSKDITLAQIAVGKIERALIATLINQYRQDLAQENNIPLIPRILFKCEGEINDLENEKRDVLNSIGRMTSEYAHSLLFNHKNAYSLIPIILEKYNNKIIFNDFIERVKINYTHGNSRIIHSKNNQIEKAIKMDELNTIDDNPNLRMVFAINILNEGWDVLSLFDIVKMDVMPKNVKKTPVSEIQLIGRGSRIFPYAWKDNTKEYDPFRRKFEHDLNNTLRHLEVMCFYSASDHDFIASLTKGLVDIGLMSDANQTKKNVISRVEKNESLTEFAKKMFIEGVVISNGAEYSYTNYTSLNDYKLNYNKVWDDQDKQILLKDNYKNNDNGVYKDNISEIKTLSEVARDYPHLIIKALHKCSAWSVNSANLYLKTITSENSILEEVKKISNSVAFKVVGKLFKDISYLRKLDILIDIFSDLGNQIKRKQLKKVGKKSFTHVMPISKTFHAYTKNVDKVFSYGEKPIKGTDAFGNQLDPQKFNFAIYNSKLFYYDNISWDSGLELEMYKLFDENFSSDDTLVIRNEVGFKLYGNEGEKNGEGFEPDFIVLRKSEGNLIYQFFIEVKSDETKDSDNNSWKEQLLISLNEKNTISHNESEYKLVGLPFFTNETTNLGKSKEYINKISTYKH